MTGASVRRLRGPKYRAIWRDTSLLLREFSVPLLIFLVTILGGGVAYFYIALLAGEPLKNIPQAIYVVLTLTFLQPSGEFPDHPLLELYHFVMPVVGISILALGLADFGILLFNRKARSKEWEMAIASTLNRHHILVGLGHLGFNVIQNLKGMNQQVAVIEQNPSADLITAVQKLDIPIIHDDAGREPALQAAGVERASSIILCIQDDALNLKIALKARSLNPGIRVIIRVFDDDFANALTKQFGFIALSGTGLAAPAFAASATNSDITRPISIEGESLSLARISIAPGSRLEGQNVGGIEDHYQVSVILVRHDGASEFHPTDTHPVGAGDMVAVLGRPDRLHRLIHDSQ